jgi:hypothetical protein
VEADSPPTETSTLRCATEHRLVRGARHPRMRLKFSSERSRRCGRGRGGYSGWSVLSRRGPS